MVGGSYLDLGLARSGHRHFIPGFVQRPKAAAKELMMGTRDKASNTAQDLKGRVKETAGRATGNKDLKNKGKSDQAKSAVKDLGENAKEATSTVKDKLTAG